MYLYRHSCVDRQEKLKVIPSNGKLQGWPCRSPGRESTLSKNKTWQDHPWPEGPEGNAFSDSMTPITWIASIPMHSTCVSINWKAKLSCFGGHAIFKWKADKPYS